MKKEIKSRAEIEHMVNTFYRTALEDELIGPIFTDIAQLDFDHHMPIMYRFWESVLLGKASYEGNPMTKHIQLSKRFPLKKEHFDRWLELWEDNIEQHFTGAKAEEAIQRARSIAGIMAFKVRQDALT